MSAETLAEFEALRVKCVATNADAPHGTREVFFLVNTGLKRR